MKCLWFGRDVFGRRSLLWQWHHHTLSISSVASKPAAGSNVSLPERAQWEGGLREWAPA